MLQPILIYNNTIATRLSFSIVNDTRASAICCFFDALLCVHCWLHRQMNYIINDT